jgi:hypothetical protein
MSSSAPSLILTHMRDGFTVPVHADGWGAWYYSAAVASP